MIRATSGDGTKYAGDQVDLRLSFSEPVNLSADARIRLTLNTRSGTVLEITGPSTTATQDYEVPFPVTVGDLTAPDRLTVSAISLVAGTVSDQAGNPSTVFLPGPAQLPGSLNNITIDNAIPVPDVLDGFTADRRGQRSLQRHISACDIETKDSAQLTFTLAIIPSQGDIERFVPGSGWIK